jgi:hypothetical protein
MINKPIGIKLEEISAITGDEFFFLQMRDLLEEYATQSDPLSVAMVDVVNKFHLFCGVVREEY